MNPQQHRASDPAKNVWVTANAGTGKTRVLTQRVLRLLLGGAIPRKILCITFTKAAAAEMLERVQAALGEWAMAEDMKLTKDVTDLLQRAPEVEELRRARRLFVDMLEESGRVRIQTIHSFCQSVLQRFPVEAGLAPHFTVLDDAGAQALLAKARQALFSSAAQNARWGEAVDALSFYWSDRQFETQMDAILSKHHAKFTEIFSGAGGLDTVVESSMRSLGLENLAALAEYTPEHLMRTHVVDAGVISMPHEKKMLETICTYAMEHGTDKTDKKQAPVLQAWLRGEQNIDQYIDAFLTQKGAPRESVFTKKVMQKFPEAEAVFAEETSRLLTYEREYRRGVTAQTTLHYLILAHALLAQYGQMKRHRVALDYDDLILYTARLLSGPGMVPWVMYKLDAGLDHLLVDEAQDTNPGQWKIIDALCGDFFSGDTAASGKRTIFVVGDEKQSIYRFQGAEPQAFETTRRLLQQRTHAAGNPLHKVPLQRSYRSTPEVLRAIDDVFRQPAAKQGLMFDEAEIAHEPNRTHAPGRVELWPLVKAPRVTLPVEEDKGEPTEEDIPAEARLELAERIARHIQYSIQSGVLVPSRSNRPMDAGDVMILVRKRGPLIGALQWALRRHGVAVAGTDRLALLEDIAVMDCLALGDFVLLPEDDLTLATVLRSPLCGVSEEDLMQLAYDRGKQSLWQVLQASPAHASVTQWLKVLLAKSDYLTPYAFFGFMLHAHEGLRRLKQRLGQECEDALALFLDLVLDYSRTDNGTLQGFLHWMRAQRKEIKREMDTTLKEVRIMTVHAAKGLQAPRVYLPDTTTPPKKDSEVIWVQNVARNDTAPRIIPLYAPSKPFASDTYRDAQEAQHHEALDEYRRLLYVAMTRAEDELYICGAEAKKGSGASWYQYIEQAAIAEDWPQDTEGRYVLCSSVTPSVTAHAASTTHDTLPSQETLPEWCTTPVLLEPGTMRPLSPSKFEEEDDDEPVLTMSNDIARRRGIAVHRLLQYLPEIEIEQRSLFMEAMMAKEGELWTPEECQALQQQLQTILTHSDYAVLFGVDSLAEVPVTGILKDAKGEPRVIAGQIDRIAVTQDSVYILDYKTGAPPEGVPHAPPPRHYAQQMRTYAELLLEIYPDKQIKPCLLWTQVPALQWVPLDLQGTRIGHAKSA